MLAALALAALVQLPVADPELAPGTNYDPSIPTPREVLGHDVRAAVTPPADVVRYMEALAEAAPDRTRLIRYATSWEGRPLVALVVGAPERIARLEEIKAGLARLADPRGLSRADAEALVARLPVVTALMHGVHGNEISSSGAAMAEAYHLLAARGDAAVDLILSESLVIIDPVENPDGRNRFVQQNRMGSARWADPAAYSAEHDEPWPGGRVNHYLFDLNRDLFIQSQPETAGKVRIFLEYWPQIVVDLHEMGGNSTYFFPPTAPPSNPWFGEQQVALMDVFGRANAAAFDARGFAYFNRDVYDLFYPGYVDMWPMSHGALGMTYEQASARALVLRRSDGDLLTYGDGVLHHFTAAITTAETAARHRDRILRDYLAFRREGARSADDGPAEYVLHSAHDPGMAERLARLMVRNGIEAYRAAGPVRLDGRTLPQRGTFIVPLDQPASRFARDLLDPHVPMEEDFVQRQIERRARRERDEIYDLTAWSQSLLWDVEAITVRRPTGARGEALTREPEAPTAAPLAPARVGYLIPWGTNGAAAVAEALREGIRVRSAGGAFRLGGRDYPVGTAIVRTAENGPELAATLGRIAAAHGAEVVPIDDSYVREGMSLGSGRVRALREPRVLLLYDRPGSTYSVGWTRYVLERRYGQRTTAVRAASLGRVTLSDWDVIVVPSGDYRSVLGDGLVESLRSWMRDGGTLITLANGSVWASRAGLLATATERRGGRAAGGVLVEGSRVFTPITLDRGTNVGRFAEADGLVLSGVVWDEAVPQLANKAFLVHQPVGRGRIVAFAEDPNYRAYTEATSLLFMNAVLLGPGC